LSVLYYDTNYKNLKIKPKAHYKSFKVSQIEVHSRTLPFGVSNIYDSANVNP